MYELFSQENSIVISVKQNFCIRRHLTVLLSREHSSVNTVRPTQNGRYFADDIFKCIFINEKLCILINISLKFVPKGRINNIPVWVR